MNGRGSSVPFLNEIQRPFEFQLQLCALRQVQLVAAPGFHQVGRQRPQRSAFGGFFLVLVLYALHGADCRSCRRSLRRVLLRAASALD